MILEALSLGPAVPSGDFEAAVHSVFRQAVNLQPGAGELLFTLLGAPGADLPQGIRLASLPGFSFEDILHAGEKVSCRQAILGNDGGSFRVDLRKAKHWQCRLPRLQAITPPVAAAWTTVWKMLNERQERVAADMRARQLFHPDTARQTGLARRMGDLVRELVERTRQLDDRTKTAVAGLVGLGTGLTPVGDDFLVGYLAGLWVMMGASKERQAFFTRLSGDVIRHSQRTNDISRTCLFHAARGHVSSTLVALAEALASGVAASHLLQAAGAAMETGHSSGMDAVSGLLVGFAPWGEGVLSI